MADDKNRTFVESNVDDSSVDQKDRTPDPRNKYAVETRPIGDSIGERAAPGSQGFLYADTPQATVYVGKKQWIQEEWTYIADPSKENNGRLYETWKRDILERIITRKLEWLSDGESFTKIKNVLGSLSEFGSTKDQLKASLISKGADPNSISDADLNNLLDLEFAPVGFTGNATTRYYTAPLAGAGAIAEYATALATLRQVEAKAGPDDANALQILIADQLRQISSLTTAIQELEKQLRLYDAQVTQLKALAASGTTLVTDEFGAAIAVSVLLAAKTQARNGTIEQHVRMRTALATAKSLFTQYESKASDLSIDSLRKDVETKRLAAEKELEKNPRLVPLNAFNGIVEFANVTNISTSISLTGNGTASITIENPRNLLRISKQDILLALSEDPELLGAGKDRYVDASPSTFSSQQGRLTYYRGRYYNPAGLQVALENSAAFSAADGFKIDPDSVAIARYRKQQQAIYADFNNRLNRYPAQIQNDFRAKLGLTSSGVVSSGWIAAHSNQLAFIMQGSIADGGAPNPQATKAVSAYHATLANLEKQLAGVLSPTDANAGTAPMSLGAAVNNTPVSSLGVGAKAAATLFPALEKVSKAINNVDAAELSKQFYRDLQVHFQGKWVVEVGDTVWVWMTSPSRTIQVSPDGVPLVESTNGIAAYSVSEYAEVRNLQEKKRISEGNALTVSQAITIIEGRLSSGTSVDIPTDEENLAFKQTELNRYVREAADYTLQIEQALGMLSRQSTNLVGTGISAQSVGTSANSPTVGAVLNSTFGGLEEVQYQVFEGVVTGVTGTFNGTDYTLQLQCRDLTYYLEMSRIIQKPTLNSERDTIAILNDPIYRVPKTEADKIRLVKNFGGYVPEGDPRAGRWKSGVFVVNHEIYDTVAQGIVKSRNVGVPGAIGTKELVAAHGLSVYEHLFTGLDSANLISLLVTGVPYNLSIYAANLVQVGAFSNFTTNANGSVEATPNSIFALTKETVNDQNSRLGNFKPFLELTRNYSDEELGKLTTAKRNKRDAFNEAFNKRKIEPDSVYPYNLTIQADFLEAGEKYLHKGRTLPGTLLAHFEGDFTEAQLTLTIREHDLFVKYVDAVQLERSYESQLTQFKALLATSPVTQGSDVERARGLRELNRAVITPSRTKIVQRTKENFLLVSDEYSANIDLQPYIKRVSRANMEEKFRSSYQNVYKLCREAAEIVDFEFYCDENGHMRFKQPTYNRTLKEHIDLNSMTTEARAQFVARFPGLESAAAFTSGTKLMNALNFAVTGVQETLVNTPGNTNEPSGQIPGVEKLDDLKQLNGESTSANIESSIIDLRIVMTNYHEKVSALQLRIVQSDSNTATVPLATYTGPSLSVENVFALTPTAKEQSAATKQLQLELRSLVTLMLNKLLEVQTKLTDTTLSSEKLDFLGTLQQKALDEIKELPYFFDDNHIHRISPNIVLSESFSEQPPEYVRVDVTGLQDFTSIDRVNSGTYLWAGGVDYDLWHTYGFREAPAIQKPFIHTRDAARLYCEALLSRQKSKVFNGNLTVRGDSKYRVGDCVFIEDLYMYFYITGVSHTFSYQGDYTTSLTLEFSRRPGEFIAHPFDVIGKIQSDVDANTIAGTHQLVKTSSGAIEKRL